MGPSLNIRNAMAADAVAILEIYAPIVRDTAISFEFEPPSESEMAGRKFERWHDEGYWVLTLPRPP